MVYTRPYDPSVAFRILQVKKIKTQWFPRITRTRLPKERQSIRAISEAEHTPDKALNLANKYEHNRFSYGLNSAGVYVYAQDVDKVITQFALLPYKNITVTQVGSATPSRIQVSSSPTRIPWFARSRMRGVLKSSVTSGMGEG